MITENQILAKLDDYKLGSYCQFVNLDDPYSYLIDSRLNMFKGNNDDWAIVAKRLGYNPRRDGIVLDIYYFGNCLINLEHYAIQLAPATMPIVCCRKLHFMA